MRRLRTNKPRIDLAPILMALIKSAEKTGMSVAALAEKAGLKKQSLYRTIRVGKPRVKTLEALARALDLRVDISFSLEPA